MITPAQFQIFVTTANVAMGTAYQEALSTPIAVNALCQTVPSQASQNAYPWTGMLPKMREWLGPRVTVEPGVYNYILVNQAFEGPNVSIDRFRLDDDKAMYGVYWRMLADMARQAARQPEYMLRDLLENAGSQTGTRQNGVDGLPGFYTAHPIDPFNTNVGGISAATFSGGTFSNDFTGGGSTVNIAKAQGGNATFVVGGAFSPTALTSLVEYMMLIPAEDGEAIGVTPTVVMTGTTLKVEAELVLKNQYFAPPAWGSITGQVGVAENAIKRFGLDLIVNPLLKAPATWYVADQSKGWKPFIYQVREPVTVTPRVNENDPLVFDNHAYMWGQWGRMAVGWSYPWLYARSGP